LLFYPSKQQLIAPISSQTREKRAFYRPAIACGHSSHLDPTLFRKQTNSFRSAFHCRKKRPAFTKTNHLDAYQINGTKKRCDETKAKTKRSCF
jgi:DNA/RNA endonuclease G (NUC1)